MTTYCDEIEAGMATSFNNLCSATFTEIRLLFMISMIFQRAPRATVFNIFTKFEKYIAQNTLKLHTRPKENEQKKYISIYGLTTLNKAKSREVSTNDGIITQIF